MIRTRTNHHSCPPRTIVAGSHEAAILEALIPAAGRWIDGDVILARISAESAVRAHTLANRLVRWKVVRMERTSPTEARLMLPREFVGVARQLLDNARTMHAGPRVCVPAEAPRWMVGGAAC